MGSRCARRPPSRTSGELSSKGIGSAQGGLINCSGCLREVCVVIQVVRDKDLKELSVHGLPRAPLKEYGTLEKTAESV